MGKTRNYYIYYFIAYLSIGAFFPFLNVYLENIGLTGSEIGQIGSYTLIAGMVAAPIWGIICDKTRRYKAMLALMTILTALTVYFTMNAYTYVFLLILLALQTMFRAALFPVMDSLTLAYCAQNGKDYAPIRGIGSAGYVAGSFVVGYVADMLDYDGAFLAVFLICLMASLWPLATLPSPKMGENTIEPSDEIIDETKKVKSSIFKDMKLLVKNKHYVFILLMTIPTTCVMNSANGFSGNHLVKVLGADLDIISWFIMVQALPEVFFIAIFNRILNRFNYKVVFMAALFSQILRLAVYAFVPNIYAFLGISLVHALITSVGTVGTMNVIRKVVDEKISTTAMTIFGSFISLVQAIFAIIFGMVYENMSSYTIYVIALVITTLGVLYLLKSNYLSVMDKDNA